MEGNGAAQLSVRLEQAEEELHSLSAEIIERYEEATLIYRLSERLGAVLGESNIARLVLEDASQVLGARVGEIWLGSGDDVSLAAAVPSHRPVRWEPDQDGAFIALNEHRAWTREARGDRESVVAVPLPGAEGVPIGALVLHGRAEGRSYRSGEVKLLTALASLTAAFIRNDRLAEEVRHAEARRRADEIARQIHRSLLPAEEPLFEGLEFAGRCVAAENIGGDFYGYLPMPDGSLGVAMADVSGHGVGAALYMAAAKGALQAEARRVYAPGDLLRRVNEALIADFERSDVFATAFFARFYPGGRRFSFASGGHNPPLLVRASGEVELLHRGGAALGVLPDAAFEEDIRRFGDGDLLIIYTDGLVEARDTERRMFGQERLVRQAREWRHLDAAILRERLFEELLRHCDGAKSHDDVTLVVIRGVGPAASGAHGGEPA